MKTITLKIKGYHFEHNLWSWSIVLVFFAGDAHLASSVLHALLDLMEDTTLPASSKTTFAQTFVRRY
ncbi:MAG: hypothetical protein LUQ29_04915 [Methylococcaceae bacterium]|nr:hypothetical protein [Methylococcaceae bacterium]